MHALNNHLKFTISRSLLLVACFAASPWTVQANDNDDKRKDRDRDDDHEHLTSLISAVAALQASQAQQKGQIVTLTAALATTKAQVTDLKATLVALGGNTVFQLTPYVKVRTETINGLKGPHVIFEGANVHVRSGSGSTWDATSASPEIWDRTRVPSGRGNLIIGYNESIGLSDPASLRVGSHCLIVGTNNSYVGWSGIVAGDSNKLAAAMASVLGGSFNNAGGGSAILGGFSNTTLNDPVFFFTHQCISGGGFNSVEGWVDSISGGMGNSTIGLNSGNSISGGTNNTASGNNSSVSGGINNTASGTNSTVSGGRDRVAAGDSDWVAGGLVQDL